MDAVRKMGPNIAEHGFLARSDVADDNPGFQSRRHGFGNLAVNSERRAQDHQVGLPYRLRRVQADAVGKPEFKGLIKSFMGAGTNGNVADEVITLGDAGQGRSDQPGADERHPFEQGVFGGIVHGSLQKRCQGIDDSVHFTF